MAFFSDSLRTSEVNIDRVNLVFKQFGGSDHGIWVITTELGDERSVFGTGGKVLLFIWFGCSHDFGMKHGSVAEVGAVLSAKESERQLRLIDHGGANKKRLFG